MEAEVLPVETHATRGDAAADCGPAGPMEISRWWSEAEPPDNRFNKEWCPGRAQATYAPVFFRPAGATTLVLMRVPVVSLRFTTG